MPKISVVMPVYNGEKFLKDSIDSILNQTYSDFEYIIINDCSNDNTESVIKSYDDKRIKYYKNEENLGVAGSLNKGFDLAAGEYIARMDADDIAMPDRFKKQVLFLDSHTDYGICGSDVIKFDGKGNERIHYFSHDNDTIKVDLLFDSALAHPTVMIRRSISKSVDLHYDIKYEKAEDFELWTRIADKVKIAAIAEPLLRYREHNLQVSVSCGDVQKAACRQVKYNNLERIIGKENADRYIDVFDGFMYENTHTQADFDLLCECFSTILKYNKKTGKYNKKVIGEQFSLIKANYASRKGFKNSIKSYDDFKMGIKIKLSKIKSGLK